MSASALRSSFILRNVWRASSNPIFRQSKTTFPIAVARHENSTLKHNFGQPRKLSTIPQSQKVSNTLITSASLNKDNRLLTLTWSDGTEASYPAVWLRDNCQCNQCFHQSSFNRLIQMTDTDLHITVNEVVNESKEIVLTWPDGHVTRLEESWLRDRIFRGQVSEERKAMAKRAKPTLWNSEYGLFIRRHNFEEVLNDEMALYKLLCDQAEFGLTLVEGMSRKGLLTELMSRIGVTKLTHYGSEFDVMAKQDANNAAYTSEFLGLHVDLPYYNYGPGAQFLHCIEQHSLDGGESTFCDGFQIESVMREHHPEDWEILKRTEIEYFDIGVDDISGDFHKVNYTPVFKYDKDGNLSWVTFNNMSRDSHMTLDLDQVEPVYRALKTFCQIADSPQNKIVYRLKEGECVIVDNHRVLHGRRSYSLKPGGSRLLEGGYIDWDELRSRRNVLKVKLQKEGKL